MQSLLGLRLTGYHARTCQRSSRKMEMLVGLLRNVRNVEYFTSINVNL